MHLSGVLDIERLKLTPDKVAGLATFGLQIEPSARISVSYATGRCSIDVGPLDEERGRLPLASISREKSHFILSVPAYSFLTLYVIRVGEKLYWSTNIGALAADVGVSQPNTKYERFGLKYQFWPGTETIFSGISKIIPGQRMIIKISGQQIEPVSLPDTEVLELDPEDGVAVQRAIHETLLGAVEQLSPPNQIMGVMLGGFDSALIVALLAELGRPVHAVTLEYDADKYNQRNISQVVERFGIRHDWVHIDGDLIRDGLYHYGELFDQPVTQPHYLISGLQLARTLADKGVSRALTGDGCDGLFFGYPTVFRKAKLVRTLHNLPDLIKRMLRRFLSTRSVEHLAGQPARLARQLLETTCRPDHLHFFLTAIAVDNESAEFALRGETMSASFEDSILDTLYQTTVAGKDWVDTTYISKNMVGLNRVKLASIWNHSGLDKIHSPYMMPSVTAMAKAIPKSYWLSDETPSGKFLLARMAIEHGLLSKEIVYQKKMSPVSSPADYWLRHDLRSDVEVMLAESSLLNSEYCNDLMRKRWLEEWYKRKVTIDDYACQALCMLLSYSRMVGRSPGRDE